MKSKQEKVTTYYNRLKDALDKISFLKDSEWLDLRVCGTIGGGNAETLLLSDYNSGIERIILGDMLNYIYNKYTIELENYTEKHKNILIK